MQIRDTRLATLAAATGLWMCVAAPAQAVCESGSCTQAGATTAAVSNGKPVALSKFNKRKSYVPRKSKSAHARQAAKQPGALKHSKSDAFAESGKANDKLPSWFVNAQAAIPSVPQQSVADDQARNIAATDDSEIITLDGVQIASADQLNDIDRGIANDTSEFKADGTTAIGSAPTASQGRILRPVASGERQVLANTDSDPWSKTSLIGKIFIAFGSLLTVASAARMLIA